MFHHGKIARLAWVVAMLFAGAHGENLKAQVIHDQGLVHVVYLSPSDVSYDAAYEANLESAIVDLQSWFSFQLDGASFSLAPDPVTWFQLSKPTSFYQQQPGASFSASRFWNSVLDAAKPLVNWSFNDPDDIYLFYIDADHLPGQSIGGTSGVALMAANDLRGLSGRPLVPINPGDADIWTNYPSDRDRWIGGVGHELGHALGLDHPGSAFGGTIMEYGYLFYPSTSFSPAHKDLLLQSSFISRDYSTALVAVPEPMLTTVMVSGGLACLVLFRRRVRRGC